jgi:hypothetical protein
MVRRSSSIEAPAGFGKSGTRIQHPGGGKEDQVPDTMKVGSILIKEGALLPKALKIESEPSVSGWRLVTNFDGLALDRAVREAGWTFFCMAGEIKATAFGFGAEKMARRAVARILAQPRSMQFNSLAITEVTSKRFLGLLPCVSVAAQSRHIQESLFLFSAEGIKASGRAKPAATQTQAWGLARAKEAVSESTKDPVVAATPTV